MMAPIGKGMAAGLIAAGVLGTIVLLGLSSQLVRDRGSDRGQRAPSPYGYDMITLNATSVSPYSVTLNGEVTFRDEGFEIEVCFEWGESPGIYTHETPRQNITGIGPFSAEISGPFVVGDTYYFRAKGYPEGRGDELSFRIPMSLSIATLEATEITPFSVTLNGEVLDTGNESVIEVFFEWGESPGMYTHTTTRRTMSAAGPFSVDITGPFIVGNTYYFRARTDPDISGIEREFFIPSDVEVSTLNATMVSTLFATLNGDLIDLGGSDSVEVYFEWGESPGSYAHVTEKRTMSSPGTFSVEVPATFMPGTRYYFRARADPGGIGDEVSFYVW